MITGLQDTIKADSARSTKIDCTKSVEEYINKHDWRINANSNTGYSNAGMVNNIAGKVVANYWLDKVYTKKAGDAHRNGDIHIHDLDCLCPYCFTKDTCFKTVEYGTISIAEMLERRIQIFSVYTFNLETQKVCERQAYDLRCTRRNAKIVEVEFSDGYTVRCTPDHKFLAPVCVEDNANNKSYIEFDWRPISELYRRNVRTINGTSSFFNQKRIDIDEFEKNITPEEYEAICPRVIRITELEKPEDVYCMTVDDTHNFILETGIIAHNCCGHDLQRLLEEGFNGVPGRPASKAPKHFREALGQMANYLGILQAEWAGAQAFSSFDTFLAPYVFFDMYYNGAEFSDIKKAILQFIYNLNVPARWGQSPFTNITVDWKVPADMRDQPPMRDGDHYFVSIFKDYAAKDKIDADKLHRMLRKLRQRLDISIDMNRILIDADNEYLYEILYQISYAIFEDEMVLIDKAFYECLNEGDLLGQPFVFPIPTINITEDFDWDDERANVLFENAAKYGSSYFQNFIGSQYIIDENGNKVKDPKAYGPNDVRSMCPLSIDTQVVARRKEGNEWVIENIMLKDIKSGVHQVMYKDEWREFKPFEVEDKHTDGVNKYQYVDMDVCLVKFGDKEVKFGKFHIQPIIREGSEITHYKMAGAIRVGDKLPVYDFETKTIKPVEVTEVIKVEREPVMCITVDSPEHLFTLSNGLITHNCRLKLDLAELRKKGGGLFGADSQTGCYDDQTEVLTTNGWKLFKDVSFNDKFYTLTTDRKIEVHNPINIFQYDYAGDLCHFLTDIVDLLVTPNHRMVIVDNGTITIKTAEECTGKFVIPATEDGQIDTGVDGYIKVPYTGKVYCVEVPNNTVFVRRNGKTAWCGNSIGNITFNMARLGYLYKGNKKALYKKLDDLLEISKDCHEKKRKFVTEMNARGLYPYTRRYIRTFDTYFSTIGLNGMNEMVRNFTDDQYDITTEYGQNMCKEIMIYLRERLVEIQEETGNLYNLESSPAEGAVFRMAKSDLSKFGPREITYIECEKHGRVEIKTNDDTEYAECPICRSESEG